MTVLRALKSHWRPIVYGVLLLVAGFAAGWLLHGSAAKPTIHAVRETGSGDKLIAPFLYLEVPESTDPGYQKMKADLWGVVKQAEQDGKVSDMAVYVRDMNSGQWTAINPDHTFALASMLKLVTVMTVLHQAETHPDTIASDITVSPTASDPGYQDYMPPAHPLVRGQTYSIEDLFWHDLAESDNLAEATLESYIGIDTVKQTYAALHLPVPPTTTTDTDTPQEYSHLFRVLYSATYLSRTNSQALLDLLTRTTYTDGLVAGVPGGTLVAHKFGENNVPVSSSVGKTVVKELHDCGIVYYPGHPYFICVTTKGSDFGTLAGVISGISKIVWTDMTAIDKS